MLLPRWAIVFLAATGALAACASESLPTAAAAMQADYISTTPTRPVAISPFVLARLPTYDRSMQAVHPDVIRFEQPWNGWEYWMAFTPFPGGQTSFENPSIAVSHNGTNWYVPAGLTNPLVPAPSSGYNSDPDLSFDQGRGELVLIYRTVTAGYDNVSEMRSRDGTTWGRPSILFRRKNPKMVSPAIVMTSAGVAQAWYVDAGTTSCRSRVVRVMTQVAASANTMRLPGLERGWSAARQVALVQPGYSIWHIDVQWIAERNEYWAVYSAYAGSNCTTQELFFARSANGLAWQTYPIPVISHGDLPWTAGTMYRASALYDAARDVIQFYTSSRSRGQEWRIGVVEYRLSTFLTALSIGAPSSASLTGPGQGLVTDIEP